MRYQCLRLVLSLVLIASGWRLATAEDKRAFLLEAARDAGDSTEVVVELEVGGDLELTDDKGKPSKIPMSVKARLAYQEQLLSWSADGASPARSVRRYREAKAALKIGEHSEERTLPPAKQVIVADATEGAALVNGLDQPLTRDELDLIDVMGNTLLLDRLLPGRELKEAEGWDHDAEAMGALLGMDHVAVCEVRSVVTGEANRQVQIRLAGTVHGVVEGTATEMDLRGAYLYHLDQKRITKLNLAIKEVRKPGEVTPGLDVVAKVTLTALPARDIERPTFGDDQLELASTITRETLGELAVDAPERGYRFRHDRTWYVTSEKRERLSLRQVAAGDFLAHCNIVTLPARAPDMRLTLEGFESDVVKSLEGKLDKVAAATEWTTSAGHTCLGVLANGIVEEVPMQWRYYNISDASGAQANVAVTVEQSLLERFDDADRQIVDSLELVTPEKPAAKTAEKSSLSIRK